MIEDRLSILETVMSAVAFDRMNLHFKKELDVEQSDGIKYFGIYKIGKVLKYYQLPYHFFEWKSYYHLIKKETISYDEIKAFAKLLKQQSKVYLSKETKKDLKFIMKAIELKWNFEQLNKQLSFNLSAENAPYHWYLYYEILGRELIEPDDFLEDIRLAEKISLMLNIDIHKKFVDDVNKHKMDESNADATLIDVYDKMDFLYAFIKDRMLEKYEKLVRLNNVFS